MSGSEEQVERVARAICEADCGRITENELDRCRDLARAAIAAMQCEGIPIYRTEQGPTETFEIAGQKSEEPFYLGHASANPTFARYEKCVTCGQLFNAFDPEQVAYHDQEGEHPPMK